MQQPRWFRILGVAVAVATLAVLLAGIIGVPYRATRAPEGYDQSRLHWNTKNSTRFLGANSAEIGASVARAVYPAVDDATRPDVVILYAPEDWQGGLAAASLLRSLRGVLLPAASRSAEAIEELGPLGSDLLGGAQILLVNEAQSPSPGLPEQRIAPAQVRELLERAGHAPRHTVVVNPEDPRTAVLAAPWLAYSGDLVAYGAVNAAPDLPSLALGDVEGHQGQTIRAATPAATAVAFARWESPDDPLLGWGMHTGTLTGYRAYTLARPEDPAAALLSANLAVRGKPGPLLYTDRERLPQSLNDYLWSQRAAHWVTPSEGPFHHFWILGDLDAIAYPAQAQADYAVEIGAYPLKGPGLAELEMVATVWVVAGIASAAWIAFHGARFLPQQMWIMRLAWPLLAFMLGPFGIPLYHLAYDRALLHEGDMAAWDRPLWLQAMAATASSVGFGGTLMVLTGYLMTLFGLPLFPSRGPLFWLGSPMVLSMIASYAVAVLVSWPLYQTPMLAMFHSRDYAGMLLPALPVVLVSMASVSLAMFPGMWWLMMINVPMMPSEESILWFGFMFFTVFMGFIVSWPINYNLVWRHLKSGIM